MKKLLTALIIIIILAIIGGVIWFLFFQTDAPFSNNTNTEGPRKFFSAAPQTQSDDLITTSTSTAEITEDIQEGDQPDIPTLRQISDVPTAGFVAFEREASSSDTFIEETGAEKNKKTFETIFRYIERATGHIYETKETTLEKIRLSNTTMPRIREAYFSPSGKEFVFRSQSAENSFIETYWATFEKATTTVKVPQPVPDQNIEGNFLTTNITSFAFSPISSTYAYVIPTIGDLNAQTHGYVYGAGKQSSIFTSDLSGWVIRWVNENLITFTSKADSRAPGILYNVNPKTGASTKILSGINGLTTLTSPKGTYVLYSLARGNILDVYVYNTKDGTNTRLDIGTLPEKCAWSTVNETTLFCAIPQSFTRAGYPETWYQGKILFSDDIWQIDVDLQNYVKILTVEKETEDIFDIIQPTVTAGDEYFIFLNKWDLTLWSFDILNGSE